MEFRHDGLLGGADLATTQGRCGAQEPVKRFSILGVGGQPSLGEVALDVRYGRGEDVQVIVKPIQLISSNDQFVGSECQIR